MTPAKALIATTLVAGTVAVAPAAYLAYENRPDVHVFSSQGLASRALDGLDKRVDTPAVEEVVPVDVPAPLPEKPKPAPVARQTATISDAPPTVCQAWRKLQSSSPSATMVRACDGARETVAPPTDEPAPASTREQFPSKRYDRPAKERYEYTFEIGAPD
jgi:hypothetical protein